MSRASLLLLVILSPVAAQPDRFGLPACSGPDRELAPKHSFILCYSSDFKAPVWAIHELSPSNPAPASLRMHFRRDWSLSAPGASDSDYRNSGLSRGHLVPARDVAGDEQALSDSFLLSNAVPQNSTMNMSKRRRLENWVRKLTESADSVIVVTGAIFAGNPERIGTGRVAVPSDLYKVILVRQTGRTRLIAVMMPNTEAGDRSLESFMVAVSEVENRTGLKFFPELGLAEQHGR